MLISNWDNKDQRDVGARIEHRDLRDAPAAGGAKRSTDRRLGRSMGRWGGTVVTRGRWDPRGLRGADAAVRHRRDRRLRAVRLHRPAHRRRARQHPRRGRRLAVPVTSGGSPTPSCATPCAPAARPPKEDDVVHRVAPRANRSVCDRRSRDQARLRAVRRAAPSTDPPATVPRVAAAQLLAHLLIRRVPEAAQVARRLHRPAVRREQLEHDRLGRGPRRGDSARPNSSCSFTAATTLPSSSILERRACGRSAAAASPAQPSRSQLRVACGTRSSASRRSMSSSDALARRRRPSSSASTIDVEPGEPQRAAGAACRRPASRGDRYASASSARRRSGSDGGRPLGEHDRAVALALGRAHAADASSNSCSSLHVGRLSHVALDALAMRIDRLRASRRAGRPGRRPRR